MSFNLRSLLEEMIEKEASDLHITAGERPKLRVDGDITEFELSSAQSGPFCMTPGPDGMVVNGLIVGTPSTVTISKARINGAFGRCGYDIRFQGQAYVGPRNCGSSLIQVGVTLPTILTTWSDAEVATALSLLMSGR